MNKFLFSFIVLVSLGMVSCETDIDVNAEYQDIPIIYGVINPNDSNHYIKINKAFLGETNAFGLAADATNFNYDDGELEVTLQEYYNGGVINTYTTADLSMVRTINEIPKDPGIFDNSTNVLFRFTDPNLNQLTPVNRRLSTWKLKVFNTVLNKEITSETKIIGVTQVSKPGASNKLPFYNGVDFTDYSFIAVTGADIGRVNMTLLFNYNEFYTTSSGLSPVARTIRMNLGERKTDSPDGTTLDWELKGEQFYDNIINALSDANGTPIAVPFLSHRELVNVSLEVDIAGTELSTFMAVSAPSTSINQDKPSYTNINNGIGVFSSREKFIWLSAINPATGQVNLQGTTILYLQSLGLGFCFGTSPTSGYMCNQLP